MASDSGDSADSLKFVLLIVEHKNVLIKSQAVQQKQKKTEAANKIIEKMADISGKTMTQVSLYKKVNNFKSRAKAALSSGKPLSEWQTKLLEIVGADEADLPNEGPEITDSNSTVHSNEINDGGGAIIQSKSDAENVLARHETEETKLLNNEQLQRFVLLKQLKVLTMQQQRLEHSEGLDHIQNRKDICFDLVGFDS